MSKLEKQLSGALQATAEVARQKFVETTRSAWFNLSLNVSEIRLIAALEDCDCILLTGDTLRTLHRLINKGLVLRVVGKGSRLSQAGKLVRQLLIESKHITFDGN